MGDMNNVCYSLVELATIFDELNLYLHSPKNIKQIKLEISKNTYIEII